MKRLIIVAILLVTVNIESFACQCIHVAVSFSRRIKSANLIVLGEIIEYTGSESFKLKIIEDYTGKSDSDTISIINGGGPDCLRPFDQDVGTRFIFALDEGKDSDTEEQLYEVPICIESALLLNQKTNKLKGNITRFNSFISRVYYRFGNFDFPENEWRLNRIEKKIKRKLKNAA